MHSSSKVQLTVWILFQSPLTHLNNRWNYFSLHLSHSGNFDFHIFILGKGFGNLGVGIFIRGCSYIDKSAFLIRIVVVGVVFIIIIIIIITIIVTINVLLLLLLLSSLLLFYIFIYFFFKTHLGAHVADRIIASLSKDVSERRTSTESRLFAFMGSVFAQNNWQDRLYKNTTLGNTNLVSVKAY